MPRCSVFFLLLGYCAQALAAVPGPSPAEAAGNATLCAYRHTEQVSLSQEPALYRTRYSPHDWSGELSKEQLAP